MVEQTSGKLEIDDEDLSAKMHKIFANQFFRVGQLLLLDYIGNILVAKVQSYQ
jgi:CO dehydrogenase/acetyl-CoA synthase gamma subunit (corrinoid Fe-S protein)